MKESFGFNQELMLIYSPYPTLEPRTLQASEQFLEDDPARGRVEKLTLILLSEAPNSEEWVKSYLYSNHEHRLIVALDAKELRATAGDAWHIRKQIAKQLFTRDLFDFRLPLENDTYFFGRENLLLDYRDAARRGENRGLFGLRKTGKTSFLFKLSRLLPKEEAHTLYYDCKSPSVRQLKWYELLEKIAYNIAAKVGATFHPPTDHRRFAEKFTELLSKIPENIKILVILDEIEYISPYSIDDKHWITEYLPFWQTIWAAQSVQRRISILIAGVNPSIVEVDRIEGTQNPLFGIVPHTFLGGLSLDEVRRMLRVLGKRMGLEFLEDAVTYMYLRYGGHPLLTRLAASFTHRRLAELNSDRPYKISTTHLTTQEDARDAELTFYCRHVVSELRDFYPDEYSLLEWLSAGKTADYLEFANYPEYIRHLRAYGIVSDDAKGTPRVTLSVVARYVALEEARRAGRRTILKIVPLEERLSWIKRRKHSIIEDFAEIQRLATVAHLPSLFGPNSFPESHRFAAISVVIDEASFESFANCCNRCFVESIEAYGNHQSKAKYFWNEIREAYPSLHEALHRLKIYRHHRMHIWLNLEVEKALQRFLKQDLEGREPRNVENLWFVLQQASLDALLNALQVELARLSK